MTHNYTPLSLPKPAKVALTSKNYLVRAPSVCVRIKLGTTYSAYDSSRDETVALKIEKPNKSKRILALEYQILKSLQHLPHICPVYEFIDFEKIPNCQGLNFIIMRMLGKNLSAIKHQGLSRKTALELLVSLYFI